MNKYLKLAVKLAHEYKFDEDNVYYLCALLVKGGNVLSVGYNKKATNSFVEYYTDIARGYGRKYCMSTHAEMDCVLRARSKIDLRGSKIYVARIRAMGGLGMARPCPICYKVLKSYGIKRAYYTMNDDEHGVMKISTQTDYLKWSEIEMLQ